MANTVVHASVVALPLDAGTSMHAARLSTTSRRWSRPTPHTTGTTVGDWTCDAQYSLATMYALCRAVRAFDPNFAAQHVDAAFVDSMVAITPLASLGMLADLKQQLPAYRAAAATAPAFNKDSVADYTKSILDWWRTNGSSFDKWALAARICFALFRQIRHRVSASLRCSRTCLATNNSARWLITCRLPSCSITTVVLRAECRSEHEISKLCTHVYASVDIV